ncbi:cell death abnormality protein 1-like [Ostrea edulis]|uniref:cell death abnormality protein 1-like n=1 Tax=Ostrea edulis TaxID=37623 RepID=UPI0024AFCCB1|nr:cell death abnormality protein 1-like [Ostrea edulis]
MDFNSFSHFFLWFLSPCITSSVSQLCEGPDGKGCCSGYIWNEAQNNCTRCTDGFYGRDCSIPCPKPLFGWDCQLNCKCSSEDCHHVYGCRKTPSEDYSSLHSSEISTIPASASSTIYNKAATETAPKSTNVPHIDKTCHEESGDINKSNSTSLIAGIISLLIVAGILLILYAMAYLHKFTRIVQE